MIGSSILIASTMYKDFHVPKPNKKVKKKYSTNHVKDENINQKIGFLFIPVQKQLQFCIDFINRVKRSNNIFFIIVFLSGRLPYLFN
jgi:hypothetical protein